jgi:hypothetical protein
MTLDDLLSRLESNRPKPRAVPVVGLGTMYVLPLTVGDVDTPQPPAPEGEPEKRGIARGLMRILCDADGKRFPDDPRLLELLAAQDWAVLKPLSDAATGAADAGNA